MGIRPTRYYSKRQEKKVANELDLKPQPNSGATLFKKGDAVGKNLLMENKTLTKPQKSITIKKEWLDKLREEQFITGKTMSVLNFDFGDNGQQYVVMRLEDFKELYEIFEDSMDQY